MTTNKGKGEMASMEKKKTRKKDRDGNEKKKLNLFSQRCIPDTN